MRTIGLILVLLATFAVLNFVRAGADFAVGKTLPFCGGRQTSLYDFGGLILLGLMVWGILRMRRSSDSNEVKSLDENCEDSQDTTVSGLDDSDDGEQKP